VEGVGYRSLSNQRHPSYHRIDPVKQCFVHHNAILSPNTIIKARGKHSAFYRVHRIRAQEMDGPFSKTADNNGVDITPAVLYKDSGWISSHAHLSVE